MARIIPPAMAPAIIAIEPLEGAVLPALSPRFGKWPAIVGWSDDGRVDISGGGGTLVVGGSQMLPLVVTKGACVVGVIDGVGVVVVEYTEISNTRLNINTIVIFHFLLLFFFFHLFIFCLFYLFFL